jgi:hypothetical protein
MTMKKLVLLSCLLTSACGDLPGPSVPMQSGSNLDAARAAVTACAPVAPKGGQNAVVGSYVGGVLFGGLLLGPIIVASNEDNIRINGEANAVDRCLAKQGYVRRDLTAEEVAVLNRSGAEGRRNLLNHLVGGGTLQTYRSS